MRIKERPRRFLAIVLSMVLALGSIPEAMNYVTADAVTEDLETEEKAGCSISILDKAGIVTDSAVELKYRIVATDGALFPTAAEDPIGVEAQNGVFSLALTSTEVAGTEAVQGIQIVSISHENYTSVSLKNTVLKQDAFATGGSISVTGSSIEKGFISKEILTEALKFELAGRPEFEDPLVVTAKNGSGDKVLAEDWAKSIEISGSIEKQDEEVDYSAYSVYWYEESNRVDTEITGAAINATGEFTFSVLEEGTKNYHFYVKKNTDEGEYISREQIVSVKKDETAPKVSILSENMAENTWATGAAIEGTVEDDLSGIAAVYYTWDDGNGAYGPEDAKNRTALKDEELKKDEATEKITCEFSVFAKDNVYKNKKLYLIAADNAGNESAAEVTLNLDGMKPKITVNQPENQPENIVNWTNEEIPVVFQAIDENEDFPEQSGIKNVYCRKATGEAVSLTEEPKTDHTYTFTIPRENFVGTYAIWCEDNAGNISDIKNIEVYIDIDKCVISSGQATPSRWTNGKVTVEGTITDVSSKVNSGVKIDSIKYYKANEDISKGKNVTSGNTDGELEVSYSFELESDDYNGKYIVCGADVAGNITTYAAVSVTMDKTLPKVESVKLSTTDWLNERGTLIVTGSVMDIVSNGAISGIKTVYYGTKDNTGLNAIAAKEVSELETTDKDYEYNYEFEISSSEQLDEDYYIWCEDNAGNCSESKVFHVKIDTEAPQLMAEAKLSDGTSWVADEWTKQDVIISGQAVDVTESGVGSGIREVYVKIEKNGTVITDAVAVDNAGKYSYKIDKNADAVYTVVAIDNVGHEKESDPFTIRIDKSKPEITEVKYNDKWTAQEFVSVIVKFHDMPSASHSGMRNVYYQRQDEKEPKAQAITEDDMKNGYIQLSLGLAEGEMVFDGTFDIWCDDKVENCSEKEKVHIKIDTEAPQLTAEVKFADGTVWEEKWTNKDVVISGRIHDGIGSGIQIAYIEKIEKNNVITTNTAITMDEAGEYTYRIDKNTNATYMVVAVDNVNHEMRSRPFHIQFDKEKPRIVSKEIDSKGFIEGWTKQEAVSVSIVTEDEPEPKDADQHSGVKTIYWEREDGKVKGKEAVIDNGSTISLGLDEGEDAFNGTYTIWCVDAAGNESQPQEVTVMIDRKAGVLEAWTASKSGWAKEEETVTITGVAYDDHSGVKAVTYQAVDIEKASEDNQSGTAMPTGEANHYSFTLKPQDYEGNYSIQVADKVGNTSSMEIGVKMDNTKPEVNNFSTQDEGTWTKDSLEITGSISDNLSGTTAVYYSTEKDEDGRKQKATAGAMEKEKEDGTKASFSFTLDNTTAAYDQIDIIYVWCEDVAGNLSEEVSIPIRLDNTKPEIAEVKKTEEGSTVVDTLLEIFTLGIYKAPTELKVIVNDNSAAGERKSDIASVYWEYEIMGEKEGSGIVESQSATMAAADLKECEEEGYSEPGYWEGTVRLNGNYRGKLDFLVTDYAGNEYVSETEFDGEQRILIDTNAPVFENYSYPPEQTRVSNIHYYSDTATVSMQIREANFQYNKEAEKEVIVLDNNVRAQNVSAWNRESNGITWKSNITLSGEGTHVITANYTDPAGNAMNSANSETIVIDRTAPVISVAYDQNNSNRYYNTNRRATIMVQEVNFDASRVHIKIPRTNVLGEDIGEVNYNGANLGWSHNGNVHTTQIDCPGDANYTLQITATDLANNEAQKFQDTFTVDTSAPANLSVSYGSLNSFSRSVDGTTFTNYYNNQIQVTISATDATSGVENFVYSYKKGDGVSGVNAELINAVISQAEIVQNGNEYSATFYIPREALGGMNQFNGTVDFTAYDRSGNSSMLQDNRRIIVDNISPTADITYSEPVREANGVAYYDRDIEATLVINEANFAAGNVEVQLEQDGNTTAITPSWTDDTTDVHTGRFTISGDGDYRVIVNYTDYSDNQMAEYRSEQMTIDTEAPTISVSGIRANSATNSEENFAFTITAQDTNLDSSTFRPVLTAVIPDEQGNYQTTEISLGEMTETPNGDKIASAAYSVENLERDAFYTLTCTVSDMVNHTNQNGSFTLTDKEGNNGGEMEQVQFSINREGSTFHVTKQTEKVLSDYYVKNLTNAVVVEEINVDPIENYVVELNNEILSEEDGNYTSISEGNGTDGSWCKRTYSLNSTLFENEGEYNIVVHSTDKADTIAYSDVKNVKVAFVVDETAPTVAISGLSENSNYQTTEQKVTVLPKDDGGKLNSFEALVDGESQIKLSGEELENYLEEHDGAVELSVSEGINREVEIICMDSAIDQSGNGEDYNIYRETFGNITVSPNSFVLFFANKPLFYGSIAGVVLLGAFLVFIIVVGKRKERK